MAPETSDQRHLTTDRERIRSWADAHRAVPVSTRAGETETARPTFVHRDELDGTHEESTWEEFFETFEEGNWVFVYHEADLESETPGEGLGTFEFVERDRAFDRTGLGRDEFEDALRRGETVTSEIVETRVVEREIVERDTIESEVVEADVVERHVVDSELIDRDVVEMEFVDDDRIEVLVDETRLETVEEIERLTVESRVVDVDVNVERGMDHENEEIETDIGIESVQRSILESDVVHSDVTTDDVLADEVMRSRRTEGDAVHSELIERRTIEEELEVRRRMLFTLESADVVDSTVIASDVLEGEVVDVEEYGTAQPGADTVTGEPMAETATAGAPENGGTESIELTDDDQGKDVVDATGESVGIVATVEEETIYVDPEPGIADRLKARFNWGDHDEDDYPVQTAQIAEVTDDEVVLRSE